MSGSEEPRPMTTQATSAGEPPAPVPGDEQELQREIERTREQLGGTVEQLAAKADVRAQAKAKAAELTGHIRSAAGTDAVRQRGAMLAAGASILLGSYLMLRWWRTR